VRASLTDMGEIWAEMPLPTRPANLPIIFMVSILVGG